MNNLQIFVNNEIVFEFDRNFIIDDDQLAFLDRMDSDMSRGIKIQGESLQNPDAHQRATFVCMNLIRALKQDNEGIRTASCAYLVNRLPKLTEVHVNDHENTIKVDFVEEAQLH